MTILETIVHLRDDLKIWVANNINALNSKIEANKVTIDSKLDSSSTNPVQNKAVSEKVDELRAYIAEQNHFSGNYNDLVDAPNITEDNSNNVVITDDIGNIIFKVDADGAHTTKLELESGDLDTQLGTLNADLAEHASSVVTHITQTDRDTWNNKSEFSGSYTDLTDAPNILVDSEVDLSIADEAGNIIFKVDESGAKTTKLALESGDLDEQLGTIAANFAAHDENHARHITDTERSVWNNKSDIKSYSDLQDAPDISNTDDSDLLVTDKDGNIVLKVGHLDTGTPGIETFTITADNATIGNMYQKDEVDAKLAEITYGTIHAADTSFAPIRSILDNGVVPIEQKSGDVTLTKIDSYTYKFDCNGEISSKKEFLLGQVRYYDYDYGLSVAGLPDIDTVRIESRPWDSDSVYTFYNSDIISRDTQPKWEIDFNKKIHDIYLVINGGVSGKDATIAGVICRNERTYDRLLQISNENANIKYVPNLYFNDSLENYKLYPGDLTSVYPTSEFTIGDSTGVTFTREFSEEDNSFVLIVNGTAANDFYYPVYEIIFNTDRGGITFYGNHESVFGPNPYYDADELDEIYPFTFTNNMYTLHGGNIPYAIDKSANGDDMAFDNYETNYFIGCLYVAIKKGETFNSTRLEYNYYPSTSTGDLLQHHHVDISYLSDSVFENRATYSNVNSFVIAAEDSTAITGNNGGSATFTNNGDNTFTVVSSMRANDTSEEYCYKFLIGSYTFDDIPYGYVISGIPENLLQFTESGVHLLIETEDGSGRIATTNYNGITGKIHLRTNDIDGFEAYNSDWYAVKGKTANIYIAQLRRGSSSVNETFDFNNFKIDKCVSSHEVIKQHSEDIEDLKNRLNSGVVGGSGSGTTVDLSNYATKGDVRDAISGISFPVTKVNNKTGNITLTASDVGALSSNGKAVNATKADYATSAGTAEDTSKLGGTDADKYATKEFVADEIEKVLTDVDTNITAITDSEIINMFN